MYISNDSAKWECECPGIATLTSRRDGEFRSRPRKLRLHRPLFVLCGKRRIDRVAHVTLQPRPVRQCPRRLRTPARSRCGTTPDRRSRWSRCSRGSRNRGTGGDDPPIGHPSDGSTWDRSPVESPAPREDRRCSGLRAPECRARSARACSSSTASSTLAGPSASPAWATQCSPCARAYAKASTKNLAGKRASSPPSEMPITSKSIMPAIARTVFIALAAPKLRVRSGKSLNVADGRAARSSPTIASIVARTSRSGLKNVQTDGETKSSP